MFIEANNPLFAVVTTEFIEISSGAEQKPAGLPKNNNKNKIFALLQIETI